jgi:cobalt-zinc-cadmium efflux system membrane fusion protein
MGGGQGGGRGGRGHAPDDRRVGRRREHLHASGPDRGGRDEAHRHVGTLVDTDDPLFEIVNTSQLWAEIDVPEAEAGGLRLGQRVVLSVDGLPGREFVGTVRFVSPVVDPETRTVKARAALSNKNGELRANTYARARIPAGAAAV